MASAPHALRKSSIDAESFPPSENSFRRSSPHSHSDDMACIDDFAATFDASEWISTTDIPQK